VKVFPGEWIGLKTYPPGGVRVQIAATFAACRAPLSFFATVPISSSAAAQNINRPTPDEFTV